ncbi:MAG: hypothetical protein ACTSQZ_07435 [Candidatus Thorarchaeota archaeon]
MTEERFRTSNVTRSDSPRVIDFEELKRVRKRHLARLDAIPDRREPKPGELVDSFLEEEFEN